MRWRFGSAVTGAAVCATAFALLWPHAKNAGAVLTAQDDPARLSDLQLNSILRNDPGLVARNVEAALAAQDPGLANSFAEVAAARGISVPGDLSQRVAEAVGEENSTEHMAKGFLAGLVTGNADDGASCPVRSRAICACSVMSGTSCARASTWRWVRIPTGWCWGSRQRVLL